MSYCYPVRGVQMQEGRRALPSSPHPQPPPQLFITLAGLNALLKIQGRSHSRLLVRKTGGLEAATYLAGLSVTPPDKGSHPLAALEGCCFKGEVV